MARVSPVVNEIITKLSQDLAQAGFGEKGALIDKACADTQLSRATVCRLVKELSVPTSRKQRCDAGTSALTIEEAKEISALLMVGVRGNDKRIVTIENALDDLRANKRIKAERIDATTGEIKRLSNSAIVRALRAYGYHPEQLKQVAPVVALASKHPNHVWQIDASISTLYYMEDDGLEQTDKAVHYKNKPENMEKIAKKRLWRYVVTDHTSGAFYLEYVLGAESGENLTHCFMNAMIQRGKHGMYGAPLMVMLDPGSANTGAMFKNLCKALDVTVQINKPGNPRAKGQVEKTHDIVEVQFEGKFRLQRPKSLQEINERAAQWSVFFNGNKTHSRHGMTRFAAWSKITPAQLRIVPSLAVLRELAVLAPKECKVNQYLEVSYKGKDYSVKGIVPNVRVGEKLLVTMNPYRSDVAQVIDRDANGNEVYYLVPEVVQLEFGFREDAAMIGEQYKAIAQTPAQTALAEVEAVAKLTLTGKKRDNKQVAFAGEIDPYKHMEQTPTPAYLPKAGTALEVKTTKVVYDLLPVFEAAFKHIKPRLEAAGVAWTAEHLQWLQQRFAAGVDNDESVFDGIVQTMKGTKAVPLKAVGGPEMIKKLMAQVKLTQADMAKVVGLSRSAMGRVLNGGEYPNGFDHIAAVGKMIDCLVGKGLDKDLVVRALEGDQQHGNAADPSFSQMKKAIDMLLRKQALTQETKKHFGIFRDPFAEIGESDEVFAASQDIRYVRESLYSAVKHGGFMAVVGESGAGKSTLRRDLIERIRKENLPAVVIEPYVLGMEDNDVKGKTLKALSIAEAIISAVSPLTPIKRSSEARFRQLHQVLRDSRKAGNVHVLVIEEAHGLSIPTLKHLKRFYELEDGFKRLLSIVLIGQPELKLKLAEQNFEVREVVQRCEVVNLRPMDDVLPDYLAFKFKRAGKALDEVVSDDGIEALRAALTLQGRGQRANVSLLYPLAIGNLLMAAMNVAAELKAPKVTADIVKLTQAGGV